MEVSRNAKYKDALKVRPYRRGSFYPN